MSFLFETFKIPLWLLVFIFACAIPLLIKLYMKAHVGLVEWGVLQGKFHEVRAEEQVNIFKKATDPWDSSIAIKNSKPAFKKSQDSSLKNIHSFTYIKIILKKMAEKGETGVLLQSLADDLNTKSNKIKSSLIFLEKNNFIEAVPTGNGIKYYLAHRGKSYCAKKGYIKKGLNKR